MASKRRKSSAKREREEFRKRSLAAQKGWATRKKKEREKKLRVSKTNEKRRKKGAQETLAKIGRTRRGKKAAPKPKKPKAPHKAPRKKKQAPREELAELREENERLEAKLKRQIEIEEMTRGWVRVDWLEYIRKDGTLAIRPSTLRHIKEAGEIHTMLEDAEEGGEYHLKYVATQIADLYNVPLREVYTLLYSP